MKYILGTKQNMTQVFDKDGNVSPVTVIEATPSTVTFVRSKEKDGYAAVQLGFGERKSKNVSKPVLGHTKGKAFQALREFRTDVNDVNVGDVVNVGSFAEGDMVEVSGLSKGKGFQGVVKRHGFKGGPRSHGQKHSEREPGSIGGAGRDGGRVAKGKRMAGRMGGDRITVKGLKIVMIDNDTNQIYIKGAIPGRRGTLLEIRSTK
jgi:large subunit ribosomal protein L3